MRVLATASITALRAIAVSPPPRQIDGANETQAMTSTAKQVLAWMRRAILNYGFRRFFFGAAVWIALAMVLWAGAHLMAKGDLAHVLLFGIFVGFALFAMRLVDRPRRHEMGETW